MSSFRLSSLTFTPSFLQSKPRRDRGAKSNQSEVKKERPRLTERSPRFVEAPPESAIERVRLKAELYGENIDEAEALRRARIALANEGKSAWNKGRPHSEGRAAASERSLFRACFTRSLRDSTNAHLL
jgi:hypothetical protein